MKSTTSKLKLICAFPMRAMFAVLAAIFVLAIGARADGSDQDVYNYPYTGAAQTFTVPAGVTSISVDAYGASGTTGAGQAGKGGRVQANLTVTPGDTLYLYVGEAPHYLGYGIQPGGWNGGGDGPNTGNTGVGYPGGGATDIRIGGTGLNNRVIVAGGGGGPRNGGNYGGGDGGGLVGQNGGGGSNSAGPRYGRGGSQSSGGAGGYAWYGDGTPTYTIRPSSNGQLGQGGTGDTNSGGGGGGYYGGGGGADAGGGGGSSYTDPTLSSTVVHTQGVQTGSGQLTITVTQGDGPDAIRPVITVTSGVDSVVEGSTWIDAGATADTGETVDVSNTVDTTTAGIYTVTYSATDAAGNVGTATRIVTVNLDTLNANGTAVQWAHTTGNEDGMHYDLAQPLELRAPPGYSVVLRSQQYNGFGAKYEYDTGLEFVPDVHALLLSASYTGGGYGGIYYLKSNGTHWDYWERKFVAFARPLPDTTAPVITSGGMGIGLFENSGSGQSVYTIAASDAIGVVSYAIGGTDAASLTLTGNVVSLTADPDYEVQNSYSFTVTASDAAGNTSDPTTVTFSITDVDEIPPVITSGGLGIGLFENSGSGQSVYTIAASDANGVVNYAIGGTDAASLTLTGNVVSLIADPDYEAKNSYSFTVTASDAAGNTSDPTTVTFSITDVDEVAPVITVTSGDSTVERAIGPSTVVSGGGRIWMDRNLGASQVATSTTDAAAYGDLFQWGRLADGHEDPNSNTTNTLGSSSSTPSHGDFITTQSDWLATPNVNLWQGADGGVNNVCPPGFRLPTKAEWETEIASWSSSDAAGALASSLKLTLAPYRSNYDGSTTGQNNGYGMYWSSTVNGSHTDRLRFTSSSALVSASHRGAGHSVRCIKDENIILGWTDPGATADGGETVTASGTVDTNTVGTYTITYTATDAAGNTGTATRTVTVVADTTAPVITVASAAKRLADLVGGSLTDDGNGNYTLVSNIDLTEDLIIESNETLFINTNIQLNISAKVHNKGIVFLTGNTNNQTTVNNYGVFVNEGLIKSSNQYEYFYNKSGGKFYNLNLNQGDAITQELYHFSSRSGSVIFDVKSTFNFGRFNTISGDYTGDYVGGIPYEVALLDGNTVEQGATWADPGATADTGETVTASGTVDTSVVGTYTITYTATDAAGNAGTVTRTITVGDGNFAPVGVDASIEMPKGVVASGSLVATDVDQNSVLTFALDEPVAGLTLATNGDYTFDGNNQAYGDLWEGDSREVVANWTVTDQHGASDSRKLTITVQGIGVDTAAPVITVAVAANRLADLVGGSLTDDGNGNYTLVSNIDLTEDLIIESNETLFINTNIQLNISAKVHNKGIVFLTGNTNNQTTVNNYGVFVNEGLIKSSNQYEYFYNKSGGKFYNLNLNQGDAITQELYHFSSRSGSVIFDVKSTFNFGRFNTISGDYTGDYVGGIPYEVALLDGNTVEQGATWADPGATADTGETVTASGTVDTSVVGTYTITYTATDAAGNAGTVTRTVTVVDTTADPYDTWASSFGLDPATDGAPTADPDGDGQNNLFEFTAGVGPNDALSRFHWRVEEDPDTPGQNRIVFSPRLGDRTYNVETSTTLQESEWIDFDFKKGGSVNDDGDERTVIDPDTSYARKFYRLKIVKP